MKRSEVFRTRQKAMSAYPTAKSNEPWIAIADITARLGARVAQQSIKSRSTRSNFLADGISMDVGYMKAVSIAHPAERKVVI